MPVVRQCQCILNFKIVALVDCKGVIDRNSRCRYYNWPFVGINSYKFSRSLQKSHGFTSDLTLLLLSCATNDNVWYDAICKRFADAGMVILERQTAYETQPAHAIFDGNMFVQLRSILEPIAPIQIYQCLICRLVNRKCRLVNCCWTVSPNIIQPGNSIQEQAMRRFY